MRDLFDFLELLRHERLNNICNILRNKCAMTCGAKKVLSLGGESGCLNEGNYNHERGLKPELINIKPLTRTSNAHIHSQRTAPSAQSADRVTRIATALRFPLSPTRGEGKEESVGDMKENIFPDKVFSLFTSHFSLKRPAFTLAEVLITLGIIGVVAAMTMPSLIQNYQVKETVSRLKKFTSIMNNTILMAKNDYGEIDSWDFILSTNDENNNANASTVEGLDNFIKKYMLPYLKYTEHHKLNESGISYIPTALGGTVFSGQVTPMIKLTDGISVIGLYMYGSCSTNIGSSSGLNKACGEIFVDINSERKPNIIGRDIFLFYITPNGVVPMGTANQTGGFNFKNYCNRNNKAYINGYGCTAWVIYNENMDYLHCDDLSWNGKHSCKEK